MTNTKISKYPVIDLVATGKNIERLRKQHGMTVADLQNYFGFSSPQAIYKWQRGESLPSVDKLIVLRKLFRIAIDKIVVCKGQGTACAVDRYALPEMPISYGEFKMDCDENGQFYLIFPWD